MGRPSKTPSIHAIPSVDAFTPHQAAYGRKTAAYCDLPVGSHRLRLLKDGPQTFPAMLEAIQKARSTICIETYILNDDAVGREFARALAERAEAGVEVNLLFDAWGSSVSDDFLLRLREAGVRVVEFRPVRHAIQNLKLVRQLTRRNHRKSLIVDSQIAFTGGINITVDYSTREEGGEHWRDTHLELEGPAAAELQYFFLRTWRKAKGPPLDEPRYSTAGRRPDPAVRVIASDMRRGRASIRDAYRYAIQRAKKSIYVTNAYFLPKLSFVRLLCDAAQRGVDVRIMVPGTTDVTAVLYATRSIYDRLLKAGVRMYEWNGRVLHAKTAVIDSHWCTVGSSNLDMQSLVFNLEVNAIVENPAFAHAMETMFAEDLQFCEEITLDRQEKRASWERAASWAAYLFRNWL